MSRPSITIGSDPHAPATRREFLGAGAGLATLALTNRAGAQQPVPIVDAHIHLFDQTRPQGAPYSGGGRNTLPALPARYRKLAAPLGIVGAIEIEASPWLEDNLWVLETMQPAPMMLGTSGHLQPEKPEFREYLERFHKNPLFLGIRYGNVWGYSLPEQVKNAVFIEGLKLLAQAGLAFDSANMRPDLVAALVQVKDKVPGLRIVLDHTAKLAPGPDSNVPPGERASTKADLRKLAASPGVFFKISEVLRLDEAGRPVIAAAEYQPTFDYLMDLFGEDRILFGSDWPNGDAVDHLDLIVRIAREYFQTKSRAAQEKFFWRNSVAAYRWKPRDPAQPRA